MQFDYDTFFKIVDKETIENDGETQIIIETLGIEDIQVERLYYGENKNVYYVGMSSYDDDGNAIFDVEFRVDTENKKVEVVDIQSDFVTPNMKPQYTLECMYILELIESLANP